MTDPKEDIECLYEEDIKFLDLRICTYKRWYECPHSIEPPIGDFIICYRRKHEKAEERS